MVKQNSFCLPAFRRGFHLITSLVEKELPELPEEGLLNLFIQHTSAGLTINENADPRFVQILSDRSINSGESVLLYACIGRKRRYARSFEIFCDRGVTDRSYSQ